MPLRRNISKIAKKAPIIRDHIAERDQLKVDLETRDTIISGLRQDVTALQRRNDEWASEVRAMRGERKSLKIVWPTTTADILQAPLQPRDIKTNRVKPPFKISWVIPPMGPVSGGHTSIFRFIRHMESQGHRCQLYFYDPLEQSSLSLIKQALKSYPNVHAKVFYNAKKIADCDALFATSWHTAYPVQNANVSGKKFYFVQDYEPFFDPIGSYSVFAENTYKFGLHGITLGRWLSEKLQNEYAMPCDDLELGVDLADYKLVNTKPRTEILFYARPVTPRRGFEMGVLALQDFHNKHPEYAINFVGWDITPYEIPFPYINQGILNTKQLNDLYNRCAAGLVLSFTNMSLLPLEMLAAGCTPVINDAVHTRMAAYAEHLNFALPSPANLSNALFEVVSDRSQSNNENDLAQAATLFSWDSSFARLDEILKREIG